MKAKAQINLLSFLMVILFIVSCHLRERTEAEETESKVPKDLIFKLNEPIQLGDYVITVIQIIDNVPSPNEYNVPELGKKFVAIEVLYENRTTNIKLGYQRHHWTLIDSDGYNFENDISTSKEPSLPILEGTLNPGQKARGWITYQTPKESKNFKVQFKPDIFSDSNVEVQLY